MLQGRMRNRLIENQSWMPPSSTFASSSFPPITTSNALSTLAAACSRGSEQLKATANSILTSLMEHEPKAVPIKIQGPPYWAGSLALRQNGYGCVYVCIYVCMWYVCMYVCMYVCLFVCLFLCLFVCVFVCLYVCLPVCMCVFMFACFGPCVCLSAYVFGCVKFCRFLGGSGCLYMLRCVTMFHNVLKRLLLGCILVWV